MRGLPMVGGMLLDCGSGVRVHGMLPWCGVVAGERLGCVECCCCGWSVLGAWREAKGSLDAAVLGVLAQGGERTPG